MTLNDGERRVLWVVALLMIVGGGVRRLAVTRPEWTPGVAVPDTTAFAAPAAPFGTLADVDSLFVDGRLRVNVAGPEHLALLPGIGPALAERMVETRRRLGPYASVDDLTKVKGIGPRTVERLKPVVWIEATAR